MERRGLYISFKEVTKTDFGEEYMMGEGVKVFFKVLTRKSKKQDELLNTYLNTFIDELVPIYEKEEYKGLGNFLVAKSNEYNKQ